MQVCATPLGHGHSANACMASSLDSSCLKCAWFQTCGTCLALPTFPKVPSQFLEEGPVHHDSSANLGCGERPPGGHRTSPPEWDWGQYTSWGKQQYLIPTNCTSWEVTPNTNSRPHSCGQTHRRSSWERKPARTPGKSTSTSHPVPSPHCAHLHILGTC